MSSLKQTPEISVIMSVYNGEKYLAEAIESIINQSFTRWELVVINDCSTDSTGDILSEYASKDERIKAVTNETNLRLPASLNKAISVCVGKYIARMDADDISLPERLERQYAFMEQNADVALSSCRFFTLRNGVYSSGGCGGRCDSDAIRAMLLTANPILHPGVIARAEVLKSMPYDTSLTCTEDLELWTRIAKANLKMQIQPEYLLVYRLHDKQITATTLEKQHSEVMKIQTSYLEALLGEPNDEMKKFYISGIYFKEAPDEMRFCRLFRWAKEANRKRRAFSPDSLSYAFFEVLAEYKRCGMPKAAIIRMMLKFGTGFLAKETLRRKKCASADGARCIEAAKGLGLLRTSGTKAFPVFSKRTNRS